MSVAFDSEVLAGFLIVKTYPRLYRDYVGRYKLARDWYAIPRLDRTPGDYAVKYRGLDSDALFSVFEILDVPHLKSIHAVDEYLLAQVRLRELEDQGRSRDDFIWDLRDTLSVWEWLEYELGEGSSDFEIIWTRISGSDVPVPEGFVSLGYEPTYFIGSHFSASCDCMLFPHWHGTDPEGTVFKEHFERLNRHGLFESAEEAEEFLTYYLSFDWTETGDYVIAEVFAPGGRADT